MHGELEMMQYKGRSKTDERREGGEGRGGNDHWEAYQNMTFMKGPHCTVFRSMIIQLLGSSLGMERKAMTTKGAIMKKVMNTATLPTIDNPLHGQRILTATEVTIEPRQDKPRRWSGKIMHVAQKLCNRFFAELVTACC